MAGSARVYRAYLGETPEISEDDRLSSCFFTGHRDFLPGDDAEGYLSEAVDALIARGVTHFYAGGARGFDTCAEITILNSRLKCGDVRLTLALPFEGYDHRGDRILFAQFGEITRRCDEIVYLRQAYTPDSYQARNMYMADRSAFCVSWQKRPGGGTANAVAYARRRGVKIIPLAGGLSDGGLSDGGLPGGGLPGGSPRGA